jgi:hypothetical protein
MSANRLSPLKSTAGGLSKEETAMNESKEAHLSLNEFSSPQNIVSKNPSITLGQLRTWLQRRQENGLAPHVKKLGKRILIHESGLAQWINGHDTV